MPRNIYLLVYHQTNRPAHWSLFIPTINKPMVGKRIHVIGSPFTGYKLEFKRNYDLEKTGRPNRKTLLATVDDEYVVDTDRDGGISIDTEAHDVIETKAKEVKPPGASPAPLDPYAGRNCQHWLQDLVQKLVQEDIFPQSAVDELNCAPSK
ncbi:hypothetical protein FQN54_007997 [Arachnomyces sp. PD_36]|nr:hypothetical protein FQN54_007997 [Arachnomyces sp. PD_36]